MKGTVEEGFENWRTSGHARFWSRRGGCRLYASDRPPPLTPRTDPTDRKVFLVVQPGLYHGMQYASVRWLLASCLVVHGSRCQQAPIGQCSSAWVAGWLAGRLCQSRAACGMHFPWLLLGAEQDAVSCQIQRAKQGRTQWRSSTTSSRRPHSSAYFCRALTLAYQK